MYNKKKYLFATLCMLLLTLLLGACGTCYAWQLPKSNIEPGPFITKYGASMTTDEKNKFTTYFNRFLSETSFDTYFIAISGRGSYINQSYIVGFNKSDINGNITNVNNLNYMSVPLNSNSGQRCSLQGSSYSVSNISNVNSALSGSQLRGKYLFWSNDLSSTVTGPHETETILGPFQEPNYFQFTYPANSTGYQVNGLQNTYYSINSGYQTYIGQIYDSAYVAKVEYQIGSWNGNSYSFTKFKTLYNYNNDGYFPTWASGTTTRDNNGRYTTYYYLDTQLNFNNIFIVRITPRLSDLNTLYTYFYCTDGHTNIVSGIIYPLNTFSGDYNQQYNQQQDTNNFIQQSQNNTDEIKDTITDDSQVQNNLDEFVSGDNLLNEFGYSPIENPFTSVIVDVCSDLKDVLLGSGNQTLNISWGGRTQYLHSEDFIFPDGILFTLIHLICNGFFIQTPYKETITN